MEEELTLTAHLSDGSGGKGELIIDPVLLNSVAGSESALLWVGGGGGVDWREEVDRWDWGVEHIFRTFARKPSKTSTNLL